MSVLETCTPRDKLPRPCISVTSPDPPLEDKTSPTFELQETLYGARSLHDIRLPLREARWFNDESYLRAGPGFNVGLR